MFSNANVLKFSSEILHINWIHLHKRACMMDICQLCIPLIVGFDLNKDNIFV